MSVWVVVGGQFGSEGKGKVSAIITLEEDVDLCIRCGGPNSGHSFRTERGELVLVRQIPTGFVRPQTRLLIPAGGLLDLDIFQREIEELRLGPDRVGVDRNAMIVTERDRECERRSGLADRLSSTLCGIGSAVARRAMRAPDVELAKDCGHRWLRPYITDVSAEANLAIDAGKRILVEGTQGSGLSLYHSPFYPKVTSRDTNAAGFLSEIGLSPRVVSEIIVVFRTFPIRVAGPQAGPLQGEITWEQLQRESNSPEAIHEYTTVTNKLRRVGRFDWDQARRAIALNRPTKLALNFADYLGFENRGATTRRTLNVRARNFVLELERLGVSVDYIGTGPQLTHSISRRSSGRDDATEHTKLNAVHSV
jgi:adenylosuccinate synthase